MRILITTDTYHPDGNGSSSFNQRLAQGLKQRGHEVLVIAPSTSFRMAERVHEGVRVFGVRSVPLLSYGYRYALPFFSRRAIERVIDAFRPDVGHFSSHYSPNTIVLPILKKRGIPLLASNHFIPDNQIPYLHLPRFLHPPMRWLLWYLFRRIYEQFDIVVAPTKTAADFIAPHARMKRLTFVSNGIDVQRFSPKNDGAALRHTLKLQEDCPLLLFVGRLDREKRVGVILKALSLLPGNLPCQFLVAGKGTDQGHLFALQKSLQLKDRVRFLGFVPDENLAALYALSTAFVIASGAELQSIVTLEAMATGKPVIGADALALPELIHDGENGYLFPYDDAAALADRIQKLLTDPAECAAMGKLSRALACEHSIERTLERFEKLYAELIDRPRGAERHRS